MPSIFQNFVAAVSQQFQNLNKVPKEASQMAGRGPYLQQQWLDAGVEDGLYKAVIPQFLYKPPFGYPLSKDIPEIRRLAKTAHVSMIVNTIVDEIAGLDWKITARKGFEVPEEILSKTEEFFYNPNSNDESFDFVVRKLVRDVCEIDAGTIVKIRNLKDEFVEFYVYDGATFLKNCNIHGVLPEEMAYFQYGWATGSRPTPFNRNEIVYIMRNPRADTIYGRSNVENLFDVLRLLTYGVESNLEYFTDNNVPRGVFQMIGGSQQDVNAFQASWQEMLRRKDAGGNWKRYFQKMPVTNADGQFLRIGFSNLELEMLEQQKWFSRLAFACFGVTPDELGFTEDSNRAVSLGQSAVFKRKAIRPLVQLLEYHFTTQLVDDLPWIKGTEYEGKVLFEFDKFDLAEELSKRQLFWGDISSGLRGINEIREELNLGPREDLDSTAGVDFEEETVGDTTANIDIEEPKEEPEEPKKEPNEADLKAFTSSSPAVLKDFERINKITDSLEEEYKKILKELYVSFDASRKGIELKALDEDSINEITGKFSLQKMIDKVLKGIKELFFAGSDTVEKKLNRNLLPNSEALKFLNEYTFKNVKDLEEETRSALRQELSRAVLNNSPAEETAGKIKEALNISLNRARAIASTELARARNLGELEAWKSTGMNLTKKVHAVIDDRTSEICRHLNEKSVPVNQNFEYKGESFQGPPFHINCRSVLSYQIAK